MSVTLYLDNKKHLSSSEAARITGYTNDHVARLARQGKVEARRVGKVWYIEETSIFDFLEAQQKEQENRRQQISKERKTEYQTGRIQKRKPEEPARAKEAFRTFYERTGGVLPADIHKRIAALITAVALVGGTFAFSQTTLAKETFRQLGAVATNTVVAAQNFDPYQAQKTLHHMARENVVADLATSFTHGLGVTILTAYDLTNETYRDDAFARIDDLQTASTQFVAGIPSRIASLLESEPTSSKQQIVDSGAQPAQATSGIADFIFDAYSGARDFFARLFGTDAQELDLPQTTLTREEYTEIREKLIAEKRAREGLAREYERPTAEPTQTATTTEPTDSTADDGTTGTVAQRPVIERTVIERTSAVTPEVLNLRLESLNRKIREDLERQTSENTTQIVNNYTNISRTNQIDRLHDITINESDFKDGGKVSAKKGSFSDKLSTGGNLSASGLLSVSGSGTSTISNNFDIGGDGLISGDLTVEGTLTSNSSQNLTGTSTAKRFLASDRGTANIPAFSFEDETDLGIFSATTSELAFTTGGTERLRLDGSGNFGIGTTTPEDRLHVDGSLTVDNGTTTINALQNNNDFIVHSQDDTNNILSDADENQVSFGGIADPNYGRIFVYGRSPGSGAIQDINATFGEDEQSIQLRSGNTDLVQLVQFQSPTLTRPSSMTVATGTNVRIEGTVKSNDNLTFTDNFAFLIENDSGKRSFSVATSTIVQGDTSDVFSVKNSGGSSLFKVDGSSGNVGIGTSTPASLFDVWGNVTIGTSSTPTLFADSSTENVGIGSSTPWGQLSVDYDDATASNPRFTVGSSTATDLIVDSLGNVGLGTTTPSEQLALSELLYVGGAGTSTIEDSLHVRDSLQVGTSSLYLDTNSITNLTGDLIFQPSGANNVGVGTTSPAQTFSVAGNGYFTEGLGVGVATTAAGVIETSGNTRIGGDLTVTGDTTTLGETDTDTLVVNSTVGSDIIPNQNKTYDLGSSAFFWDTIFADTIDVNTLDAASSTISGTQSEAFTINSDNDTADTEDMDLIFFRGTVVPNAVIQWDSSNERFDFNQSIFVQNDSTSTTNSISLELIGASDGKQTADLLRVASSSGDDFVNVTNLGNVGIGTSSPNNLLEVNGGIAVGENYNFTAPTNGAIIEGSVGVGTSSPSETFSLQGSALFSGDLDLANLAATGTLDVTGDTTLSSALTVSGDTSLQAATSTDLHTTILGVGNEYINDITGNGLTITTSALTVDESQLNADDFSTNLLEGSVVFSDGSTLTEDNANFFWNDSNNRLGIGTNEPATTSYSTASAGGSVIDLVESSNDEIAQLNVRGIGPSGAGLLYVGQGPNFGGGFMFKGDNTPSMPSDQNDISIFRRDNGTDTEVLHWAFDSNTAEFEGDISVNSNNIQMNGGWITNDGDNEGIAINNDGTVGIGTQTTNNQMTVSGGADFSGSVAVGTSTTPTNTLDVEGGAAIGASYSGDQTAPTDGLIVEGNVGIGTSSPGTNQLEVAGGDVLFNNNLTVGGGSASNISLDGNDMYVDGQFEAAGTAGSYIENLALGGFSPPGTSGNLITDGNVGVGDNTPDFGIEITASTTNGYFGVSSLDNNDGDIFTIDGSGNVGIGTNNPTEELAVSGGTESSTTDGTFSINDGSNTAFFDGDEINTSSGSFHIQSDSGGNVFLAEGGGNVGIGGSINNSNQLTVNGTMDITGSLGIGTTTPGRKLSVTETVSNAQFSIAYDGTRYTNFLTNSSGDLSIDPQGDDVILPDENLQVCTGGACPSGPSGNGNITVEGTGHFAGSLGVATTSTNISGTSLDNVVIGDGSSAAGMVIDVGSSNSGAYGFAAGSSLNTRILYDNSNNRMEFAVGDTSPDAVIEDGGNFGIGTTTPAEQFAVANNVHIGGGGSPALGTATSTYEGDIKIQGKLDVGTIDPVYTIDGTKYATYGHSTIGIKEETTANFTLTKYNEETGYYEHRIDFDELERGSDLWLFYQVTKFGSFGTWNNLVVTLTPGFDGRAFYEKDPATSTLVIKSTEPGEVSARLVADRFDSSQWPNLRPDQDDDFTNFELESKPR